VEEDERDRDRHLRQATPDEARYGFAEPARAGSDGREGPWLATRRTRVDLDTSTPAGFAAAAGVALAFDRSRGMAAEFMATAHEEAEEWQAVALLADADLWLTVEETGR
jgi:hypothetical protein